MRATRHLPKSVPSSHIACMLCSRLIPPYGQAGREQSNPQGLTGGLFVLQAAGGAQQMPSALLPRARRLTKARCSRIAFHASCSMHTPYLGFEYFDLPIEGATTRSQQPCEPAHDWVQGTPDSDAASEGAPAIAPATPEMRSQLPSECSSSDGSASKEDEVRAYAGSMA